MIDRQTIIKILSYAAYFVLAFFLFLLLLFPFDRIKSRLETEVRNRTPVELSIARISPRFFNRFTLSDVVVSDPKGTVLFESEKIYTTISLFGLLRGVLSVNLDAKAYGGELYLKARQGKKDQTLIVDANGLDLGSYSLLKNRGITVTGTVGGNLEMTGNAGRGRLWAKDVTVRELQVQGFPVPDLDFERGWLETELRGDRLTIKKLELEGSDLKVRVAGNLVMRKRGSLNLSVNLKPSERLAQEQAVLFSLLKNRDADGFFRFTLGGTLDRPVPRL